jgi:pimeloyl-ACP methyl ester carboxylesterase
VNFFQRLLYPQAVTIQDTASQESLQVQIHGSRALPTLIYLPGLHGDWTLVGRFRRALGNRVRFVEITYPRTLNWSLKEYAEAVERALAAKDITAGWVLAESFGSQVVWPLLECKGFKPTGVILAGGFVRHPIIWGVRAAERVAGGISFKLLTRILFGYARITRARYAKVPEVMEEIKEFMARRTELDRQAARHRLHLLARSNFCSIAQKAEVPVYAITGAFDPIVPWYTVPHWLKKNCRSLRDYKIVWHADHNVLGTGSKVAAEQVLRWMGV